LYVHGFAAHLYHLQFTSNVLSGNHRGILLSSSGLNEWEDGILAQVLARSQQEYIDRLKKARDNNDNSDSVSSNSSSNVDIQGPSTSR
jgi:hypothetical protein